MKLPDGYFLGTLCKRNHRYKRLKKSLRKKSGDCALCTKERSVEYYKEKKKKIVKRAKAYYRKNKEKVKKRSRDWYQKNKKKRRKTLNAYRENNRKKMWELAVLCSKEKEKENK